MNFSALPLPYQELTFFMIHQNIVTSFQTSLFIGHSPSLSETEKKNYKDFERNRS